MTKRRCCSSKKTFRIYKVNVWFIANRIAQRKRGRQQIHYDRDRSLPTPVSFSMLNLKKPALLEKHYKILSEMISPIAQWDRINTVATIST